MIAHEHNFLKKNRTLALKTLAFMRFKHAVSRRTVNSMLLTTFALRKYCSTGICPNIMSFCHFRHLQLHNFLLFVKKLD